MTNDLEIKPDLSDNEDQLDNKSSSIDDNVSELSLASTPELNEQPDEPPFELHDQVDEVLHIDEENKEEVDDLTQFINKARQQGFNCLDLSKKNITEFPNTLLEFPSLQVNNKQKLYFFISFFFR